MPSYKNLAIIALAASFVSPAQSALNREYRKQSRGEVKERMDTEELERPETNFALRTVPAFSKRSFGRSSKRATDALPVESRAIAGLEERSKAEMAGSVAMAVTGLVGVRLLGGGLYHSIKTVVDHSKSQRDVSPSQMNSLLDTLGERADVPLEDQGTILRLLIRALNELD